MPSAAEPQFMCLTCYARFIPPADQDRVSDFYVETLGWPRPLILRVDKGDVENKDWFWAGETVIVNHNNGATWDHPEAGEADPATARQIQIYRVSHLDALVDRLRTAGVTIIGPQPCYYGREAFILDPIGMLVGLRERDATSPLPQDREAKRRRLRGEAFNPGCGPMPRDWQEVGWVRLRVADVPAMTVFYRDVVGLGFIGQADDCALFDLGDNTTLELAPGGAARPIPAAQKETAAATILRVTDFHAMKARFKAAGLPFVHELYASAKGDLAYIADPEGNLLGIYGLRHPGDYVRKAAIFPEELEAQRRWVELQATRAGL